MEQSQSRPGGSGKQVNSGSGGVPVDIERTLLLAMADFVKTLITVATATVGFSLVGLKLGVSLHLHQGWALAIGLAVVLFSVVLGAMNLDHILDQFQDSSAEGTVASIRNDIRNQVGFMLVGMGFLAYFLVANYT